jgi:hypothetical protein
LISAAFHSVQIRGIYGPNNKRNLSESGFTTKKVNSDEGITVSHSWYPVSYVLKKFEAK